MSKAWMALVAVGACGAAAMGQVDASGMRVVEGGTIDENPMSAPMRLVPLDMRVATNFERVYEIDGEHGSLFARRDGALTAVFPRSVYEFTPLGTVAPVPAGTTWLIGETPAWYAQRNGLLTTEAAPAAATVNAMRVDLRADGVGAGQRYQTGPVALVDLAAVAPAQAQAAAPEPADVDALLEATAPAGSAVMPWGSDTERGVALARLLRGEGEERGG